MSMPTMIICFGRLDFLTAVVWLMDGSPFAVMMTVSVHGGASSEQKQGRHSSSNTHSILWSMSTPDQLLYSALHGTAMRYAAERRNLDKAVEELRQIAD